LRHLSNGLNIKNVIESQFGSFVRFPPLSQIDNVAEIIRKYPHIIKMFVDDLSHGGFGFIKNFWHKEQENENHRRLVSKCKASIFCLRISSHLFVNIVIFDCYNYRLNQLFVEFKPGKIVFWIVVGFYVLWSSSGRNPISGVSAKLSDLIDPVNVLTALVPVVTKNDSFSNRPLNQLIK